MLQVTEAAAAVIQGMREGAGASPQAGVRLEVVRTPSGQDAIGLAFRDEPEQGDAVTEQSGVRIFVADELSEPLGSAVLDARSDGGSDELIVRTEEQ